MDPRKRRQLIITLVGLELFILFVLAVAEQWGILLVFLLLETLVVAGFVLHRRGIWPRWKIRSGKVRPGGWIALGVFLFLLVLFLTAGVYWYTEWLWFESVGYLSIFTTQLLSRLLLFLGVGIVAALFLGGNLALAWRWLRRRGEGEAASPAGRKWGLFLLWLVAAAFGVGMGLSAQGRWLDVLRFFQAAPVGRVDPLFGRDVGYYLFQLPLLLDLKGVLLWLVIPAAVLTGLVYALGLRRRRAVPSWDVPGGVRPRPPLSLPLAHLSVLGALFLLVKAWDYQLQVQLLVYSQTRAAYGAGYTDVHARWPAYNILTGIVVLCAVLLLLNFWRPTWRFLALGLGLWLVSLFLLGTLYPFFIQSFIVSPSELDMERPYIEYNIRSTLAAYRLEEVAEEDFPLTGTLTLPKVLANAGTVQNIRLWDHRPLYQTYSQLQEIRLYYNFYDIDVERYRLGDRYREVELSVRELSVDQLPETAQTWVNRHLVYTHGYGVVLSPVNEFTAEGQPRLLVRDIPPQTAYPELELRRPEIYFGEQTDNYIIVKTTTQEFDYPAGDQNVFTTYQGRDGVPVASFFRRLAFALRFGDLPILVSEYITPESRLLFRRTVQERVQAIAPFLRYDYDPYPVILDGKIYWLQDAYTVSDMYPYSRPVDDLNYIRNSVKVVVDAYEGTTTFYLVDPEDPLAQTYARIFPGLFRPVEEMPAGLRAHWRYPEELFRIQSAIYATYHMRDPQVFYNKEDAWHFARETYGEEVQEMAAYYVIMRLPDWEEEEFLLMVPFTPVGRDNMIAWMHVQCDGEDYGRLGVFKFPKQSLVYGPLQIEARMNQDPFISQQFTLWDQRGSNVIRGNLLVIPVDQNLLYVAPIYLQAEAGQIPELKRVVVACGERVAMAETLEKALAAVLEPGAGPAEARTWPEVARSAQEHYRRAQECLRNGDWACYGEEMRALEEDLEELVRLGQE